MTPLPLEFQDLLKSFNAEGLKYLLIGGWAVGHYGYKRYTADIDFWIAVSPENAHRLIRALHNFIGAAPTEDSIVKEHKTTEFGRAPLKVRIMCDIAGAAFEACHANRVETDWSGIPVPVIGAADLVKNKQSTGRLKDKADANYLTKLAQRSKRKNRKK